MIDRQTHDAVLADVRAAGAGDGPLGPTAAILLAFAGPCRLLEKVAPDRSQHRHAKARIEAATTLAPLAPEVSKLIEEIVVAAATAAVVAGAVSSS